MPRPDVPGHPVTEYEEVWRYLLKDEIGMDEVEKPTAWILESDDDGPVHNFQQGIKTFLARIEGRYLALQQMCVHSKDQSGNPDDFIGEVSAKSEEFVDGHRRVKHALGPIMSIFHQSAVILRIMISIHRRLQGRRSL
jgi:hypothetical protein